MADLARELLAACWTERHRLQHHFSIRAPLCAQQALRPAPWLPSSAHSQCWPQPQQLPGAWAETRPWITQTRRSLLLTEGSHGRSMPAQRLALMRSACDASAAHLKRRLPTKRHQCHTKADPTPRGLCTGRIRRLWRVHQPVGLTNTLSHRGSKKLHACATPCECAFEHWSDHAIRPMPRTDPASVCRL